MTTYLHEHRGETIRPYELLRGGPTREGAMLDGHDFEDCDIHGPAVLLLMHDVAMSNCTIDEKVSMVLLELDSASHPDGIVGVIGMRNCRFYGCRFKLVSWAGDSQMIAHLRSGFS